MEKNTSKAYVEPTGPIAGALSSTGEAGTPLFLINLCASMAPVQLASKTLPGLDSYRLYQVTRVEDGRTRYRLRLGFFATRGEAEDVLAKVREQYPTAFTACLCEEDRRHTRGYVLPTPAKKPTISVVPPAQSTAKSAPASAGKKTTQQQAAPAKVAAGATPNPAQQPGIGNRESGIKSAPPVAKSAPSASKLPQASSAIEVSWEPNPSKPAVGKDKNGEKPAAPSLAALAGLDDLTWEPPALSAKPAAVNGAASTAKAGHETIAPSFKTQPVLKAEPAKAPSAPAQKPAAKLDTATSMRVKALELTLSDPPPPPSPKAQVTPNEPFHVGKGVDIPSIGLSLQSESAKAATPAKAQASAAKPAAKPSTPARAATPQPLKAAPAKPAAPAATKAIAPRVATLAKHPDLDSTQTIRALTAAELNDEAQEKCFAIQLAASEQPVNLDAMPHLDIFEAYRLYSVATAGSGKIVHSLRLGFFKEAVSAEAVAGYLKTFFSSPTVLRISVAEQTRFKDATLPKKPDPNESRAQPNVVELNAARSSRAAVPTVTMEVAPGDTSATGSFKMNNTGSFRTSDTATHRALPSAVKPAAKSAAPATKRSPPMSKKKTSTTGKYKAPVKKSLAEQLLEEAKEVELSESGIYKMQKNESLLSRLVDKLKK